MLVVLNTVPCNLGCVGSAHPRTSIPPVLELLSDFNLDAFLIRPLEHISEEDVGNLLHFLLCQLAENDDFVQSVQELGPVKRRKGASLTFLQMAFHL